MGRRLGPTNAEKRRAVLAAAAVLIAERGRRVSLAEICSRAGVSRQSIYNHYGDKQGLFAAVAAQGLEPCPCCPDPAGLRLEILLSRYAASLLEWTYAAKHVTALRACCRGVDAWDAASFGARTPASRSLAAVLRQERLRGRLRVQDPTAAAALFLDLVLAGPQLRIVLGTQAAASPADIEVLSSHCARLFVRGCCEPRSRPPQPPARHRPPRGRAPDPMSAHAP